MSDKPKKPSLSLDEKDIASRRTGRRAFIGAMAVGGAAATAGCVVVPTGPVTGPAADSDNGTWTDSGSCPRGAPPRVGTGRTDRDSGNWTDRGGQGRGAPYC